jgi:branched-chain amino acid transport system permease protein
VEKFFVFFIIGVATSAVYAISATGLVVTYVTSGVFNFAHGAIGMFVAFVYWELRVHRGWPTPVALAVTLLVIAPAIGALLDIIVMRPLLKGASVATRLVVTLALLLAFQGGALAIWGIELRTVPGLWGNRVYSVLGLNVSWDQTTTILAAVAVAFGFRALFRHTKLGIAMRAVVDNRELCAIKGLNPNVVTAASWAMGSSLAGLAAILIAPGLNLEVNTLSLLVVSAYAAAVLGRLQNLPATFAGALILGVAQAMVVAYLPSDNQFVRNLGPAIPFVLLFAALLARRELRLPERIRTHSEPEPPSARATWAFAAIAVLVAIPVSGLMGASQLLTGSKGLIFAAITISLVLLTGLSGQVSLMQMSFAGLGAVVLAKLPDGIPFIFSLGIAALIVGIVGGLVALPALRLRGLYLALITLALAILMDNLVFGNSAVLGGGTTLAVERPDLFGLAFESERSLFILLVLVAGVFANVFLAVRRSAFGRKLAAMRDAPNACQTLGMNITVTKLKVFGLSALMAGVAGAFLGGLQSRIGQLDFLWFRSLSVLLVATVFGITSMSGAFIGALFFVVLPDLISSVTSGDSDATASLALQPLIIGILAIVTARRPEGIAGQIRNRLRGAIRWLPPAVWAPTQERTDDDAKTDRIPEVSLAR